MTKISGHISAITSRLFRCCLVIVAVGQIRHTTALAPMASNLTEGFVSANSPTWIDGTDSVFFIDGSTKKLVRYQMQEKKTTSVELVATNDLMFLVPVKSDVQTKFIVGFDHGVALYTWDGLSTAKIKDECQLSLAQNKTELVQCGVADVTGRFWMGASYVTASSSTDPPKTFGRLYSVDENGTGILRLDKIGIPGGITWNLDSTIIYHSDTTAKTIVSHSFNKDTGQIQDDRKVVFDFHAKGINASPGGITIDTGEYLWVACVGRPYIIQIDPKDDGKLLQKIDFPATASCMSVTFGSLSMMDLYVTTINQLFLVTDTNSQGIPLYKININNWPIPKP